MAAQKPPVIDLLQDGTRYFDLHHTPDDTLDQIDPAQLEQNVDAWARVLRVVAEEKSDIRSGGVSANAARSPGTPRGHRGQ